MLVCVCLCACLCSSSACFTGLQFTAPDEERFAGRSVGYTIDPRDYMADRLEIWEFEGKDHRSLIRDKDFLMHLRRFMTSLTHVEDRMQVGTVLQSIESEHLTARSSMC